MNNSSVYNIDSFLGNRFAESADIGGGGDGGELLYAMQVKYGR